MAAFWESLIHYIMGAGDGLAACSTLFQRFLISAASTTGNKTSLFDYEMTSRLRSETCSNISLTLICFHLREIKHSLRPEVLLYFKSLVPISAKPAHKSSCRTVCVCVCTGKLKVTLKKQINSTACESKCGRAMLTGLPASSCSLPPLPLPVPTKNSIKAIKMVMVGMNGAPPPPSDTSSCTKLCRLFSSPC